jgi:hypothetical protein
MIERVTGVEQGRGRTSGGRIRLTHGGILVEIGRRALVTVSDYKKPGTS